MCREATRPDGPSCSLALGSLVWWVMKGCSSSQLTTALHSQVDPEQEPLKQVGLLRETGGLRADGFWPPADTPWEEPWK